MLGQHLLMSFHNSVFSWGHESLFVCACVQNKSSFYEPYSCYDGTHYLTHLCFQAERWNCLRRESSEFIFIFVVCCNTYQALLRKGLHLIANIR